MYTVNTGCGRNNWCDSNNSYISIYLLCGSYYGTPCINLLVSASAEIFESWMIRQEAISNFLVQFKS